MAAQSAGKTPTKKDTATVRTSTASVAATGQPNQRPAEPTSRTSTTSSTAPPTEPTRPAPSARSGIQLNHASVSRAFFVGGRTRSVKAIQYALEDRGFTPGNKTGYVDQATRDAFTAYQRSIGAPGTGSPTDEELDYLGFDVI